MIQTLLINRAKIAEYKQISKSVFDDVLNSHIRDAQFDDVKPLIGERLYNAIVADQTAHATLLNGGTYTYNGITYINQGLKSVIVYYTYARYMMFGDVVDTPFSLVNKLNQGESQRVDYATKKSLYQINQNSAFNLWLSVRDYLIRTNYALYENCLTAQNKTFNFSKIV